MRLMIVLFTQTVQVLLLAMIVMMTLRVILGFFSPEPTGFFSAFVYNLTETAVFPVRTLFDKLGWEPSVPLDIPFMVTYLIFVLLQALLPTVGL